MIRFTRIAALGVAASALSGCLHIYEPRPATSGGAPAGASAAAAKADDKGPFKPWDEVLKDTRPVDGFFKLHQKRDQTLFVELRPDQLDKDFGLVMHISRGTGVFNLQDGLPLSDSRLMRFRRVGDRVYLVHQNARFTADAGSPMKVALDDNVGHSIVASFKVESEHKESKAIVIDATSFLVTDYAQIADNLKWYYGGKPISFDKERSFIEKAQAFPRNNEIDALLTFRANDYATAADAGVSDHRSIPVGVRYSFFALPEKPMQPRYFDDRVGYFTDAIRDFSKDKAFDPYQRMITRWRLEKKDPAAEKSEPVNPIVYYIDASVPKEYRPIVKRGIEGWNRAFEKAGFINAIVAKEVPENDPTWSAEDIRYSTVRWTPAHSMGYAIGPSQTDPRTGEILNADILISSEFVRGWANTYSSYGTPEALSQLITRERSLAMNTRGPMKDRLCMLESGMAFQVNLQYEALIANGTLEAGAPMPQQFLEEALIELTLHEVGHTLGLRHNMKGSSAIPNERLHDKAFTSKHGVTLSVMDYAPVNIALNSKQQGHYYAPEVGSYDEWAIMYGYAPVYQQPASGPFVKASGSLVTSAADELPALRKIASLAAEPMHTYGTDEDTHLGPLSVDPGSNTWDLGSDVVRYGRDRVALLEMIKPKLESRMIADGDGYNRLRGSVTGLIFQRYQALYPSTKMIGGLHFARDHKGDPNGRAPFTPVPASRQREAIKLIVDNALAENAFRFEASLLNKLTPTRQADWSGPWVTVPIDFPVHGMVNMVQSWLVEDLLDGARLQRMIDNGVRTPGNDVFSVADLFETMTGAIFAELGTAPRAPRNVDSFRRNLQRSYIEKMTRTLLNFRPLGFGSAVPEDARSLARYELTQLSRRLGQAAENNSLNVETRAHFAESKARIDKALETSLVLPPR